MQEELHKLNRLMEGEIRTDKLHRHIYATDASVYRKLPLGVAYPKNEEDIKLLIDFARAHRVPLIPRTAGTSLAGQVVGEGLIVDVSKYMNGILDFDEKNRIVTVQPGVIRDELNAFLKPYGLWFSPNTSTSNRCMIGGMTGNNSSGTTSIKYGVTRDKVIRIKGFFSDGTRFDFQALSKDDFNRKINSPNARERAIYRYIRDTFSKPEVQEEIRKHLPKPTIHRRNTGYAIETLVDNEIFSPGSSKPFNLSKLIAGSEGTLVFMTEITLKLDAIPPSRRLMVAAHFNDVIESMKAVAPAMEYDLYQCELMDKTILDCTKDNIKFKRYRDFLVGDPKAILMLEFRGEDMSELEKTASRMVDDLKKRNLGYAFPFLKDDEAAKAEELRKAGLGLLGNLPGDEKAVVGTEDTAVDIHDLPNYIADFTKIMQSKGKKPVYFAHAGAGEIHLRPVLNLKKSADVKVFRELVSETAGLVASYQGSLSGEHGDGIVRAEFIPKVVGEKNYRIMRELKAVFDPENILNPHKIVEPWPMDENLRYEPDRKEPEIPTLIRFTKEGGILRAAEKCNGSGDCRKPEIFAGTMCPSYRATREEKYTTRARANALREFLTHPPKGKYFDSEELYETLNLCLSCKACKSECPSSVDVAMMKAEFLYQWQEIHGYSLQSKFFAFTGKIQRFFSHFPWLYNAGVDIFGGLIKRMLNIAPERKLPKLSKISLEKYLEHTPKAGIPAVSPKKSVYLFVDEFTGPMDTETGKAVLRVLTSLGYEVIWVPHVESGRTYISTGFLKQAKTMANRNVKLFAPLVNEETPLIGIEPSAILTFRDEYPRLVDENLIKDAEKLAQNTLLFEEFIAQEFEKGSISADHFTDLEKHIKLHVHCHHKALADEKTVARILSIPRNYHVELLDSGCCGMAGSFGYKKENYDLSKKIGELKLFPALRNKKQNEEIAANGISCRHQIEDMLHMKSKHPAVLLAEALH